MHLHYFYHERAVSSHSLCRPRFYIFTGTGRRGDFEDSPSQCLFSAIDYVAKRWAYVDDVFPARTDSFIAEKIAYQVSHHSTQNRLACVDSDFVIVLQK